MPAVVPESRAGGQGVRAGINFSYLLDGALGKGVWVKVHLFVKVRFLSTPNGWVEGDLLMKYI